MHTAKTFLRSSFAAARLIFAIGLCWHLAAHSAGTGQVRVQAVPGLENVSCWVFPDALKGQQDCNSLNISVRVIDIMSSDVTPQPIACLALLPYNALILHTGLIPVTAPVPTPAPTPTFAKIKWTIDGTSSTQSPTFVGTGMIITESMSEYSRLFGSPPTIDPHNPLVATVTIQGYARGLQVFNHLPSIATQKGARTQPCLGVDPIIINAAD